MSFNLNNIFGGNQEGGSFFENLLSGGEQPESVPSAPPASLPETASETSSLQREMLQQEVDESTNGTETANPPANSPEDQEAPSDSTPTPTPSEVALLADIQPVANIESFTVGNGGELSQYVNSLVQQLLQQEKGESAKETQNKQAIAQAAETSELKFGVIKDAFFKIIGAVAKFFMGSLGKFRSLANGPTEENPDAVEITTNEELMQKIASCDSPDEKKKIVADLERLEVSVLDQPGTPDELTGVNRHISLQVAELRSVIEADLEQETLAEDPFKFMKLKVGQVLAYSGVQRVITSSGKSLGPIAKTIYSGIGAVARGGPAHACIVTAVEPEILVTHMNDSTVQTQRLVDVLAESEGPYRLTSMKMWPPGHPLHYDPQKTLSYLEKRVSDQPGFDYLDAIYGAATKLNLPPLAAGLLGKTRALIHSKMDPTGSVTCVELVDNAIEAGRSQIDPYNLVPDATYFASSLGVDKNIVLDLPLAA